MKRVGLILIINGRMGLLWRLSICCLRRFGILVLRISMIMIMIMIVNWGEGKGWLSHP